MTLIIIYTVTLTFSIDIIWSKLGYITFRGYILVLGRFLPPEVSILIQNQTILLTKHVYGAKKLLSLLSSYYYVFGPKGGASASIAPPLNPPLPIAQSTCMVKINHPPEGKL